MICIQKYFMRNFKTEMVLWVIGSIILLVFNTFGITSLGNLIIGIIASIVLVMGVNQIRALHKKLSPIGYKHSGV